MIMIGQTVSGNITEGGIQISLPACNGVATGIGRMYELVAPIQIPGGHMLRASTCQSPIESWDGRLSVYGGGTCQQPNCVTASATFDCGPGGQPQTGLQELVTWCSIEGVSYFIVVHTDALPLPPEGNYTLTVTDLGTACGPGAGGN